MTLNKLTEIKNSILANKKFKKIKNDDREIRLILKNVDVIDPYSIEEYIANDGYLAAYKALTEMNRESIIEEIKKSGLRGRSGGAFPTGIKWSFSLSVEADEKYIICNADEGIPGDFIDRILLEKDPHAIVEGLIIGAIANDANKGYFYIRKEYLAAHKTIEKAIFAARKLGFLGKNIFDQGYDFDIEIRIGAGSYVCGEETALMESIEGKRGTSRAKPPFPAVRGLFGKPTCVNNVKTLASVTKIILNGAESFNKYGTENSKGTNIFSISGKVKKPGFYELPLGISIRELIFGICQGPLAGKTITSVLVGGPAGGFVSEDKWNSPLDYDLFHINRTMLGAGGIVVIDETICIVDMCLMFLEFGLEESCGKCSPCRYGTKKQIAILKSIIEGKGKPEDLEELKNLSEHILSSSLCGLGMSTSFPLLSALMNYEELFIEHLNHKCRANVCKCGENND